VESSDADLVARVLDGQKEAFAVLVDRHYDDCARYAHRALGNRSDAEDALQETFLRAYRALPRYRERDAFRAWLFRILVNRCRTAALARSRWTRRFVQDERAMTGASIASHERGAEVHDGLQRALDTLETSLREAVLLKHGEGMDYEEMARVTGVRISALKMRVKRGVDAIRPLLEAMRS
jgi:RNA polymerase sigma-70 factor (ECF subfamily)